jgi:hypothetical protein
MSTGYWVVRAHIRVIQAHTATGALVGTAAGAWNALHGPEAPFSSYPCRALLALPMAAGGLFIGGAMGALTGAFFPVPHLAVLCAATWRYCGVPTPSWVVECKNISQLKKANGQR